MSTKATVEGSIKTILKAGCSIEKVSDDKYLLDLRPDVDDSQTVEINEHWMVMFAQGIDIGRMASINALKNEL